VLARFEPAQKIADSKVLESVPQIGFFTLCAVINQLLAFVFWPKCSHIDKAMSKLHKASTPQNVSGSGVFGPRHLSKIWHGHIEKIEKKERG